MKPGENRGRKANVRSSRLSHRVSTMRSLVLRMPKSLALSS
jgi:hypothetical protein